MTDHDAVLAVLARSTRGYMARGISEACGWFLRDGITPNASFVYEATGGKRGDEQRALRALRALEQAGRVEARISAAGTRWVAKRKA